MRSKLDRITDKVDDAEYELRTWGFAKTPSQYRAAEREIERLRAKRDRVLGRRKTSDAEDAS